MENIITPANLLEMGIKKAGSMASLARRCDIGYATLWRIKTGKSIHKPWDRTLSKLLAFIMEGKP
jgi:hypothetical protein